MDVSRQSVSKWESTNSIPDLNKIIKLSELFGVSTDFLLKDNMDTTEFIKDDSYDEPAQISLEDAIRYTDIKFEEAKLTSKGTAFCICSPSVLFLLLALSESSWFNLNVEVTSGFGVVSALFMISAGIAIFIKQNKSERALYPFEKAPFNLAYGVHSVFSEKLESYTATYNA
jgi:transcriptional regulator with XRE-family HTH domain